MSAKPIGKISEEKLQKDLEKYQQQAIDLGATDARVIDMDKLIIDERVVAKCTYPKCREYGTSANCPPHAMPPEQLRKVASNFRYGLLLKIDVPANEITGKESMEKNLVAPYRKKVTEIVAKIEAQAFYDGYYLALGFGGGSCKMMFCPNRDCQALVSSKGCVNPLKARSSMEAVGIDCYQTAVNAGWEIYPIGQGTSPEDIPFGMRMGLVLIA